MEVWKLRQEMMRVIGMATAARLDRERAEATLEVLRDKERVWQLTAASAVAKVHLAETYS